MWKGHGTATLLGKAPKAYDTSPTAGRTYVWQRPQKGQEVNVNAGPGEPSARGCPPYGSHNFPTAAKFTENETSGARAAAQTVKTKKDTSAPALQNPLQPVWEEEPARIQSISSHKIQTRGQPGGLSGLVQPSAQGVILEPRDRVPYRAPCVEPASPSACVSASLSLMNK